MNSSTETLNDALYVKNENELKNAINNAPIGKPTTIALDNDITLASYNQTAAGFGSTLIIPADKDIILTSNKSNGFYKLISVVDTRVIIVETGGALQLDGIIVTHKSGITGCGVYIMAGGVLFLYSGEISGNTVNSPFTGGGVFNAGTFVMSGGKISNNKAVEGGGVCNDGNAQHSGTFIMSGGEISNNNVDSAGGGVYNSYYSEFTLSGGKISGNVANIGGGVSIKYPSEFSMLGGEISGNRAFTQGGGVYSPNSSPFVMSGGTISGNSAEEGGGVYVYGEFFDRRAGVISGNTATKGDNDVYLISGNSGGAFDGGDGFSNGGNSSGSFMEGGFSLREVVLVCVAVGGLVVGVVVAVLFFTYKKELEFRTKRFARIN